MAINVGTGHASGVTKEVQGVAAAPGYRLGGGNNKASHMHEAYRMPLPPPHVYVLPLYVLSIP